MPSFLNIGRINFSSSWDSLRFGAVSFSRSQRIYNVVVGLLEFFVADLVPFFGLGRCSSR